jgi:hypothetical protein
MGAGRLGGRYTEGAPGSAERAVPTNLPPQYFEAEKAYRRATSPSEKVEALEAMLAVMPKHKGTDHLKADLRARIAKLTQEAQRQAAARRAPGYTTSPGRARDRWPWWGCRTSASRRCWPR